jgi:hypothetical protein
MRGKILGMKNKLKILGAVAFIIFRWCINTYDFKPDSVNIAKNAPANHLNQTNDSVK